nr:MAG TPA: hypothetical protein [Caudoviricetes sp.]
MEKLKDDYKDCSFSGEKKYKITQNTDGTFRIEDVTDYTEEGDEFGSSDVNAINSMINNYVPKIGTCTDEELEAAIEASD